MANHKWDYPKNITATCLKCGVIRLKIKPKYGYWEYIADNGAKNYSRPNCYVKNM